MQAFECTGKWCLPNDEGQGAAGTLGVSESGGLRLCLTGALGQVSPFQSESFPVILGLVDNSPFGDLVTLQGCALDGPIVGSGSSTACAYFGAHLTHKIDFVFNNMSLRLRGLAEWAQNLSAVEQQTLQPDGEDARDVLLRYRHKPPLVAEVPGARLTLEATYAKHSSNKEAQGERLGLSVHCLEARTADEMNEDYVYPLQNLMTFCSDRPQEAEAFAVRWGGTPANVTYPDIHVIRPRVHPEDGDVPAEAVLSFQMVLTLKDVDFGDFIKRWLLVIGKYSAACNVFFGLQPAPPAFIDTTLPGVVEALYLYYSSRNNGVVACRMDAKRWLRGILSGLQITDADWLADRLEARPTAPLPFILRKLLEEHSHVMNRLVSNRQGFVSKVINTLKCILFRESDLDGVATQGTELYWTMQRLRFLFKACLLHELGFRPEKVTALFERNSLYQHLCQVEDAEGAQRKHGVS